MARDDYYVVVYQILSYLYQCLKKDKKVEEKFLSYEGELYYINENYWKYIFVNLFRDGYINGVIIKNYDDDYHIFKLEDCMITPKGIEYLTENSTIEKAKKFFKETAEVLQPFITK